MIAPRVNDDAMPAVSYPDDELTTAQVCDRHPSARAAWRSVDYGLTFCDHCARHGAARVLPLVPLALAGAR